MSAIAVQSKQNLAGTATAGEPGWRTAAIGMLAVRITQGFIYWGGGSRRFIYDPDKLNPDAHSWMANKLQSAMPGALLGTDQAISFLLLHFDLLYVALILFSAAELLSGAMLMAGLLTRLAALATMGFSVILMLTFGWQGAACLDEWTMAACNLAMGGSLLLAGSGAYSLDNLLLRFRPGFGDRRWFRWGAGSLPLPLGADQFRLLALTVLAAILAFNTATYSHFRGSVLGPFHDGPVSPSRYHLTISDAVLLPAAVRFDAYLDAGAPENAAHVLAAALLDAQGKTLASWDSQALARLPAEDLQNLYGYNRFTTGPFGIDARMGAKAAITLPLIESPPLKAVPGVNLKLTTVDGDSFSAPVRPGG